MHERAVSRDPESYLDFLVNIYRLEEASTNPDNNLISQEDFSAVLREQKIKLNHHLEQRTPLEVIDLAWLCYFRDRNKSN